LHKWKSHHTYRNEMTPHLHKWNHTCRIEVTLAQLKSHHTFIIEITLVELKSHSHLLKSNHTCWKENNTCINENTLAENKWNKTITLRYKYVQRCANCGLWGPPFLNKHTKQLLSHRGDQSSSMYFIKWVTKYHNNSLSSLYKSHLGWNLEPPTSN